MTIARTLLSATALVSCASLVGLLASSIDTPAHARQDDGGVAGGGTSCATAQPLALGDNAFNTSTATGSLAVGAGGGCASAHTIYKAMYFTFTPPTTASYTFSTCSGTTWDTRIAVLATCAANQVPVLCNDDACNYQSQAAGSLNAGITYSVVVGGFGSGSGGAGNLKITQGTPGGGGGTVGPDVIVGAIPDVSKYGSVVVSGQTIMAYAIGTTSCNIGDALLDWFASPDNRHPFIPQNFYRVKGGRVEQIGMGWGKHGFTALQGTLCGACIPSSSGTWLGVGCSDPYSSGLNGSQSSLGCRSEVNAATGVFPGTPNAGMPGAAATIGRRIQVNGNDLNPTLNAGALYFCEAQYIHPGDASAGNDNNNASWRSFTVGTLTSGAYTVTLTGATNQQRSALQAWQTLVPNVTLVDVDVPNDGRFTVGYTATANANGTWHYEYAIQNINSDRSGTSFSVPLGAGVTVTNAGFHDVDYHSGDPYSPTNWTLTTTSNAITWAGGTYASSANSNALRYGTTYNFWFDANTAPTNATGTLGLFKPGTPTSATMAIKAPQAGNSNPADINHDGFVNGLDLTEIISQWGATGGSADTNGDGAVNGTDLGAVLAAWTG
jgi:hypothetical protein